MDARGKLWKAEKKRSFGGVIDRGGGGEGAESDPPRNFGNIISKYLIYCHKFIETNCLSLCF